MVVGTRASLKKFGEKVNFLLTNFLGGRWKMEEIERRRPVNAASREEAAGRDLPVGVWSVVDPE